jgi:hypothetical protein
LRFLIRGHRLWRQVGVSLATEARGDRLDDAPDELLALLSG